VIDIELSELARSVANEIDSYVYDVPDWAIGTPFPPEKVSAYLDQMRKSLVEPYWIDVRLRDTSEQIRSETPPIRKAAVVAAVDEEVLLVFSPADKEFFLAKRNGDRFESFGVNGDAVGCFMAA